MATFEDSTQVPPNSTGNKIQNKRWNDGVDDIYTPTSILVDKDDPLNGLAITNKGELKTIFESGAPSYDAFGRQLVAFDDLLANYRFYIHDHASQFTQNIVAGGVIAQDYTLGGIKLSTGTGATDKAAYNSNRFFLYRPLTTTTATMTFKAGDIGVTDRVRRFGWFGELDGIFFEWDGLNHNVVVKNGMLTTEERIEQANWNKDTLDGSGDQNNRSGAELDITKNNIWWIDYQYLGAGAIRFGTWVNGVRTTVHEIGHYNGLDRPYLKSPSLSIGVEQENTGAVGSTGELHLFCVSITSSGYPQYGHEPVVARGRSTITSTATFQPILSFRPSEIHHGGSNRDRILPHEIGILTIGNAVELSFEFNSTLTGDTWVDTIHGVDIDTGATACTGGEEIYGMLVGDNSTKSEGLGSAFDENTGGITRHFDNAQTDMITISARLLVAGSSDVSCVLNIKEIE